MVRHPSFQGLPWRYEFRQDLPVIPSVDHRCRRHRTAVSTTWRSPHTPHGVRTSDPSVLGFRFQTRHHRRHHAQQVRSGTCAGYADHRTRARARGTARRADGADRPRLALGQGVTAPIVGCSKTERVDDVIEALGVKLSESDIAYLEEPYTAHELVGPLARPGERALAGTLAPTLKEKAK